MTASIWANSVYDEHDEADRAQVLSQIDEFFNEASDMVMYGTEVQEESDSDIDPTDPTTAYDTQKNPFFRSAKEGLDRIAPPREEAADSLTAQQLAEREHVAELMREIDQA
jgi:hypothetical protein